jgi:hypothetical protein
LKAGIARLLTVLDTAKKGLKSEVQASEHILQDLRVDVVVLWPYLLDCGQLGALMSAGDTLVAFVPGVSTFLESRIVEFPATTQDKRHPLLLLVGGQEFIFEGLARCAQRLLVHRYLFCLIGAIPATAWAIHPPAKATGFLAFLW